jgi:hypothetical protein
MSERQEALQLVTVAIPPLQQIDGLYDQALQLEQRNTAVSTGAKFNASRKGTLLGLVSGFAIWFILDMIFYKLALTGTAMLVYIACALAAAVFMFFFVKRKVMVNTHSVDRQVQSNQSIMQSISAQIQDVACSNAEVINALPRDYRYYHAVSFFEQALSNGRADSMKEAVNLYEEELHRQKLENQNQQMMMDNACQMEMMANIEQNTSDAARNSGVAAAFSILNYLR